MKQKMVLLLGLVLFTIIVTSPRVHAAYLTLSPTQLSVVQGEAASFTVSISGMPNSAYLLSASGIYGEFDPSYITTDPNGLGSTEFNVDFAAQAFMMDFGPPYCPGTYPFTINAVLVTSTGSNSGDSGLASGTITVTSGTPLQVTGTTDKSAYTEGDPVSIEISLSTAAHGTITVTSPSGKSSVYTLTSTATSPTTITKTLTAGPPFGTWTVAIETNDFCGVITSTSTSFVVNPIMYNVGISLAGVPASASASVQVDGVTQEAINGFQAETLSFPNGTSHIISVDEYVSETAGIRFRCPQNSWSFNSTGDHTFNYQPQYLLSVQTDPEGMFQVTSGWFAPGTIIRTNPAPQTVSLQASGIKYVFNYWEVDGAPQSGSAVSLIMNGPHTVIAKYTTEYQLTVDSRDNLGNPQGSGYYVAGHVANFSVSTPIGTLIQQVFVRWSGDYTGTSPEGSILMDKPHGVQATWTTSYTQLYALTGTIAVVIAIMLVFLRRRRNRSVDTAETSPNKQQASP